MTPEKLRELESLREFADSARAGKRSDWIFIARLEYATALHNAAHELFAAARERDELKRRLEAMEEAMVEQLSITDYAAVKNCAAELEKERSK